MLSICGGYAVGIYCDWEDREVWKLLEAIEMVVELNDKDK